jgi:hypothetical protein
MTYCIDLYCFAHFLQQNYVKHNQKLYCTLEQECAFLIYCITNLFRLNKISSILPEVAQVIWSYNCTIKTDTDGYC